jgi:DNA-binding GntR family transcriptional regulator
MIDDTPPALAIHERVYALLRSALSAGRFAPGQRLTIRGCAEALGVSPMPVRDALRRLVADGALDGAAQRSVVVPVLSPAMLLELRDVRIALEGLAAERAAANANDRSVDALRTVSLDVHAARSSGDIAADMEGIWRFHSTLYAGAAMPALQAIIGNVWLRVGPYRRRLYPDYVTGRNANEMRNRIISALSRRDATGVRALVCGEIAQAMTWIAEREAAESVTRTPRATMPRAVL